ncbi:MAG: redox-active disulfide protein 2 [candidate division WS6 bacterium 34_10]|uniref:Redox-active disulfide protein 2 n=1 Tax=candidate division WS6 bacterium 34_10 TaxID=1641389 RepID=A0A101HHX5_9BACT|nr:MAG: redox-active disulfide protein 2 [candidate division WS6 bacterium 34_10]
MIIKVLGSGCPSCKKLYESVKHVVGENKEIQVEYITDITALLDAGIMSSPALMIDEKVVCSGRVPSEEEIKEYIDGNKVEEKDPTGGCSCGGCC